MATLRRYNITSIHTHNLNNLNIPPIFAHKIEISESSRFDFYIYENGLWRITASFPGMHGFYVQETNLNSEIAGVVQPSPEPVSDPLAEPVFEAEGVGFDIAQ